jgi:hypothetical protein
MTATRIAFVTCTNAGREVLGVKGSQVQIPSSRQSNSAADLGCSPISAACLWIFDSSRHDLYGSQWGLFGGRRTERMMMPSVRGWLAVSSRSRPLTSER